MIEVIQGDTQAVPDGIGALASRSTAIGGSALQQAARALVERARPLGACLLNAPPSSVVLSHGRFFVAGASPERAVSWSRVAASAGEPLHAGVTYAADGEAWGSGCCLARVSVDRSTGQVTLERLDCVDDAGTVVNPLLVDGQIAGGIAQGIGETLLERIVYDADGQMPTGSLMDYALPRADDMPVLELGRMSTPSPFNTLGAKGVGEAGTIGASPAIVNAVLDALAPVGVEHVDMPLTPEHVWRAIRDARDRGARRRDDSHEISPGRGQGVRARQHAGDLGCGPATVQAGPVGGRGGNALEHPPLGRRSRDRRSVHRRQAGEYFSLTLEERRRVFEIAVDATRGTGVGTIMSCSDQNMDTVIALARHAQAVGADYVVVHAPVLHFVTDRDEIVYEYYRTVSEAVEIGIAMWSHPDSGYLLSPQLCARIAELPNIVAIKYSVPREMYAELTRRVGDRLLVSTASEEEWLDNILELGWRLYLCSSPPYLLQTATDRRMRAYTDLAFAGRAEEARRLRDSLEPVRRALKGTRPGAKPQAHQKYWQELLGQAGGPVRPPMLNLTQAEKTATRQAFERCGLELARGAAD